MGDAVPQRIEDLLRLLSRPPLSRRNPQLYTSPRCEECGKFTKARDLGLVYSTAGTQPEPDHYACARCRGAA